MQFNLDDLKREVLFKWNEKSCGFYDPLEVDPAVSFAIDHLHAQGRIVPEGYVAVPLEATLDMRAAGEEVVPRPCNWFDIHHADDVWNAMIDAAQKGNE